jgi:hypothetical protein
MNKRHDFLIKPGKLYGAASPRFSTFNQLGNTITTLNILINPYR